MITTDFKTFKSSEVNWIGPFMDLLPVGICRTTLEGNIVFANQAFAIMFGYDAPRQLKDCHMTDLHQNMKDRGDLVKEMTRSGNVKDFVLPYRKKDGTPIWGAVTARSVYDEDGVPEFFDCCIRDVTGQMDKPPPTVVSAPEAQESAYTVVMDLDGRFLSVSESAAQLLGFFAKELIGNRLPEMFAPGYRKLFTMFMADIEKKGEKTGVLTLGEEGGSDQHLEFRALLVKDAVIGPHIRCTARDVAEKMKKERAQSAKEKFRGVLEMAGGVSHRLNQPLMIISNQIQALLTDCSTRDPNYKNLLKINDQVEILKHLAKKISGIKKYESMDYVAGIRIVDIDRAS